MLRYLEYKDMMECKMPPCMAACVFVYLLSFQLSLSDYIHQGGTFEHLTIHLSNFFTYFHSTRKFCRDFSWRTCDLLAKWRQWGFWIALPSTVCPLGFAVCTIALLYSCLHFTETVWLVYRHCMLSFTVAYYTETFNVYLYIFIPSCMYIIVKCLCLSFFCISVLCCPCS